MRRIYTEQIGVVGGYTNFPITRGVRQGDVLSPLIFNCVLEDAIREWKRKLRGHGIAIDTDPAIGRLTNIPFADD